MRLKKYLDEAKYKLTLMQAPTGVWIFRGSVPVHLAWEKKKGGRLADDEIETLSKVSTPAMMAKSVHFKTKEEALKAAKKEGIRLNQIDISENSIIIEEEPMGKTVYKALLKKYRFKDSFKLTNKVAKPLLKKKLIEPMPLRMGAYRMTDKGANLIDEKVKLGDDPISKEIKKNKKLMDKLKELDKQVGQAKVILGESILKYDRKKMERLIKKDKFLGHAYRNMVSKAARIGARVKISSKHEDDILKTMFNSYVLGDTAMEHRYEES
jgi:hypothetical protein